VSLEPFAPLPASTHDALRREQAAIARFDRPR